MTKKCKRAQKLNVIHLVPGVLLCEILTIILLLQILTKLYTQGLISHEEIESLSTKVNLCSNVGDEAMTVQSQQKKPSNSISECIERLEKQELGEHLIWLQDILLELCSIKLGSVVDVSKDVLSAVRIQNNIAAKE